MEDFPKLKEEQVALLRSESSTGHVLDEKLNLAISDSQKVYTVFDFFDDALNVAKKTIEENKNIECVIYGREKKVLAYLNP